jgi:hypothetical protein
VLTLTLGAFWFFGPWLGMYPPGSQTDILLMVGTLLSLGLMLWALLTRNFAAVMVYPDHVRLVTPLMRLKISYKRMRSVKPSDIRLVYQDVRLSWADKRFLKPYYGQTVITLAVRDFPIPEWVMKLFLPKYYFLPKERGYLLLIEDWMGFSTEFDSALSAYKEKFRPEKRKESMRGLY